MWALIVEFTCSSHGFSGFLPVKKQALLGRLVALNGPHRVWLGGCDWERVSASVCAQLVHMLVPALRPKPRDRLLSPPPRKRLNASENKWMNEWALIFEWDHDVIPWGHLPVTGTTQPTTMRFIHPDIWVLQLYACLVKAWTNTTFCPSVPSPAGQETRFYCSLHNIINYPNLYVSVIIIIFSLKTFIYNYP